MAENIFKNESAEKLQRQVGDLQEQFSSLEVTHRNLSQRYNQVNSEKGNLEMLVKKLEAVSNDLSSKLSDARRRGESLERAEVERDEAKSRETLAVKAFSDLNREHQSLQIAADALQESLFSVQAKLLKANEQIDPLRKLVAGLQAREATDRLISGYLKELDLATD